MKNEKGITLLVLIITVLLMIILASAGIKYGQNSISDVKLQKFSYELQQIQGRVDTVYEKMSMENNPDYVHLNRRFVRYKYEECTNRSSRNTLCN